MTTPHRLLFVVAAVTVYLSAAMATGRSAPVTEKNCEYNIYVQTGDIQDAGTDSKIALTVSSESGKSFHVSDLAAWGTKGYDYDYFQRGSLDSFLVDGPCIGSPICEITVFSDGSGEGPWWYIQSILVSYANGLSATTFNFNQWLSPGHWSATKSTCSIDNDKQGMTTVTEPESMDVIEPVVAMV